MKVNLRGRPVGVHTFKVRFHEQKGQRTQADKREDDLQRGGEPSNHGWTLSVAHNSASHFGADEEISRSLERGQ